MSQIKIYSNRDNICQRRQAISDTLHACVTEILGLPADKRFHRFIPMDAEDFVHPSDRTANYIIFEIHLFEGRSKETKKRLIVSIFNRFTQNLGIAPNDIEITIIESPRENWGIRGRPADELSLSYKIEL